MRLVVTSPYRESTIGEIASAAAQRGELARFATTLALAPLASAAARIPGRIGDELQSGLGRRSFGRVPPDSVQVVAPVWELAHVAVRRAGAPAGASRLMYRVKRRFDAGVARRLGELGDWDVVLGQMASSARTFAAARAAGKATVLNFVNSHPAAQNHYLHELAGLTAGHHEMVPPEVARDVDRELALADLVLVPSRFVLEQLRSRGLEERRLAVEPYGIDPGPYTSVQRKKRPGEDVACVMVGQIGFRKGVRILLDAARLLEGRGVRFRLVGPMVSPSAYRDPPPNVDWAGARAPAGVPAELGQADIFVLPSLEDSYGLVVLEAMAAGLPVVTTTHTGASELLTHGVEGLVVPAGDVGALVDAVQWLARDPVRRQAMGEAARRRVLATSGATSYTDRVLGRVRALLEDRAS